MKINNGDDDDEEEEEDDDDDGDDDVVVDGAEGSISVCAHLDDGAKAAAANQLDLLEVREVARGALLGRKVSN